MKKVKQSAVVTASAATANNMLWMIAEDSWLRNILYTDSNENRNCPLIVNGRLKII